MSDASRILVAACEAADADVVKKTLSKEFSNVVVSCDPERAVKDFEHQRPKVLILAFEALEMAERYYLGLYRGSALAHALRHRTVILCNKDNVQRVYEMCKKETFDDYVLFWPLSHDGSRLPMAVHQALRQLAATEAGTPALNEFAAPARQLGTMDAQLNQFAARGEERAATASQSVQQARRKIGAALDGFSRQLSTGGLENMVEVKDAAGLEGEVGRLRAAEVEAHLDAVEAAVMPFGEMMGDLKRDMAPHIESARALQALANRVRPLVLVVEDDEFQHRLLARMLKDQNLELVFASSGTAALAALRKCKPDLILMDVDLPDMNGIEITMRIKGAEPFADVPVVMMTGHSDKDAVVRSAKAGAVGFVVKPLNREVLLAKLRSCLPS